MHRQSPAGGGDGERTDASHHVTQHLARLERVGEPLVLVLQPRVPIHKPIVQSEDAAVLSHLRL